MMNIGTGSTAKRCFEEDLGRPNPAERHEEGEGGIRQEVLGGLEAGPLHEKETCFARSCWKWGKEYQHPP